jgi:hypothetical protein
MKLAGTAARAQRSPVDPLADDARRQQLAGNALLEIDRCRAIQIVTLGKPHPKAASHFGTHSETAGPDAGSDGGVKFVRTGAKLLPHRLHGSQDDAVHRAPPTRMHRANRPVFRIGQQQRQTVGCPDGKKSAGSVGNHRVAFAKATVPAIGSHNRSGVYLLQSAVRPLGDPVSGDPRAKAVLEPAKAFQGGGSVYTPTVPVKLAIRH